MRSAVILAVVAAALACGPSSSASDAGTGGAGNVDAGTGGAGTGDAGNPDAGSGDAGGCTVDATCVTAAMPHGACCDGACVDPTSDGAHCGGCSERCDSGAACCDSSCVDPTSDPMNCGFCGNACARPNASTGCAGSGCQLLGCDSGWGDCDGNPADGCEVDVQTDPQNCRECGASCAFGPNSTPACQHARCSLACGPGSLDCDGTPVDGCEVQGTMCP